MNYPERSIDPSLLKNLMAEYRRRREDGFNGSIILALLADRKVTIETLVSEDTRFYEQSDRWDRTLQKSFLTMLLTELSFEDDCQDGYDCLIRWVGHWQENEVDLVADVIRAESRAFHAKPI